MIIREPLFPTDDQQIEIVFGYTEGDIYADKTIPRGIFAYDDFHGTIYFSDEFNDWLKTEIGRENYKLSYCKGYWLRFKNKNDALKFRLRWI